MRAVGKVSLVVVAAAMVIPALAGEIHSFGRAGGAAGADKVEQVASYVSPQDLKEFDAGYGRAGGAAARAPAQPAAPDRKSDVAAA